ncbi:hypothetical protein CF326_g5047 [Tilletia indica]|nr:hypothetical protein CF326_g5047 [Tilletia indica]
MLRRPLSTALARHSTFAPARFPTSSALASASACHQLLRTSTASHALHRSSFRALPTSSSFVPQECRRNLATVAATPTAASPLATGSDPKAARRTARRRRLRNTLAVIAVLLSALYLVDTYVNSSVLQRLFRTLRVSIAVALDYKINFPTRENPSALSEEEREKDMKAINALHERCAQRLLELCERNQGLYIKVGQAIANQAAILPKPYLALSKMFDDATQLTMAQVRRVIETELRVKAAEQQQGASGGVMTIDLSRSTRIEDVFVEFDETPVAAASIAQVHRGVIRVPTSVPGASFQPTNPATLAKLAESPLEPNTKLVECAIKVQRPEIRRYAHYDLLALRLWMRAYEAFFEMPALSFAGEYISNQIEQECHFDVELHNSEMARWNIMHDSDRLVRDTCYVPAVYPALSTSRLLLMEYIPNTVRLTDIDGLKRNNFSIKEVARSACEISSAQIFQYGHVQADGHAGNLLVRKHPSSSDRKSNWARKLFGRGPGHTQHQLVLIDHGLYVSLNDNFRREYARLWRAIYEIDFPELKRIVKLWGLAEDSSELLASATLLRPWNPNQGKNKDGVPTPRKTDLELQRDIKDKIKNFLQHVELLPLELIFVGRCGRIMQANNQCLGSPVNRLNILAKHASTALLETSETPTLGSVFFPGSRRGRGSGDVGQVERREDRFANAFSEPERYRVAKAGQGSSSSSTATKSSTGDTSLYNDGPIPAFPSRLRTYLGTVGMFLRFRTTLLILDVAFWTSGLRYALRVIFVDEGLWKIVSGRADGARLRSAIAAGTGKGGGNGGFEAELQESMKRLARDELGVELGDEAFA